jgi:hypothetical protein
MSLYKGADPRAKMEVPDKGTGSTGDTVNFVCKAL